MELFVEEPELLKGTQTFFGVLITLLVLCLFHDVNSNFMLRIVGSMIEDFLSSIAHSVDRMRSDLKTPKICNKSEEIAYADNYWISQSEKYPEIHDEFLKIYEESEDIINKYVNKHQRHLIRLRQIQQKVHEKSENELISHSMMLLLMVIMAVDGIGIGEKFGGIFLFFLMVLFLPYFGYIWYQYLCFKDVTPVLYKTKKTRTLLLITNITLLLSFLSWLSVTIFMTISPVWYVFYSIAVLMIPILIVGLCISPDFRQSERYNKKFVINHTIYILITSLMFSFCIYCMYRYGLPFGFCDDICLKTNMDANISVMTGNVYLIRNSLVIFAVLNSFFIPMFSMFIYYQANSLYIKFVMMNQKHKARKELREKRDKIIELEHQILKRG